MPGRRRRSAGGWARGLEAVECRRTHTGVGAGGESGRMCARGRGGGGHGGGAGGRLDTRTWEQAAEAAGRTRMAHGCMGAEAAGSGTKGGARTTEAHPTEAQVLREPAADSFARVPGHM